MSGSMAAGKREFCGIALVYCGLCPICFRKKKKGRQKKPTKKISIKNPRKLKPEDTSNLASQSDGISLFQLVLIFAAFPSGSAAFPQDSAGKVLIFMLRERVKI